MSDPTFYCKPSHSSQKKKNLTLRYRHCCHYHAGHLGLFKVYNNVLNLLCFIKELVDDILNFVILILCKSPQISLSIFHLQQITWVASRLIIGYYMVYYRSKRSNWSHCIYESFTKAPRSQTTQSIFDILTSYLILHSLVHHVKVSCAV